MTSSPLTGGMMKARKSKNHLEEKQMLAMESDVELYPDLPTIPPEDEADTVSALLRRIADRGNHQDTSFAYQDLGEDDGMDGQALHSIVEDLQFGHDLRM
jgi:hypothetical protein